MTEAGRIVVIGAGHNGLTCAAYLARSGRDVLVLEAAHQVGGAAVTRELTRGFKVPAVAHLLQLLDPSIQKELDLARHGLQFARTALKTVALATSGEALVLEGNQIVSGPASAADRAVYPDFIDRMRRYASVLARQHGRVPPRLAWDSWRDALPAGLVAFDIRRLGRDDMREFLRVITMPIHDLLEESFETPALKGAIALDAVLGTKLGPRSGNSVFTYLHRLSGQSQDPALPRGGMGAVSEALAAAARAAGAEIRVSAPVATLIVVDGCVTGVKLDSGEQIEAAAVVSNADPKTTLRTLLGARHLEAEFARRLEHTRSIGTAAKLNLALSGLPEFSGLAPAGKHVLSAIVQYAPYDLAAGWDTARDAFRDNVLAVLERFAPGIRKLIVAAEVLTPLDLERQFRIGGGHWHHGEMTLDQFMMLRPVPGAAQYAMPVAGLFMCGAGCHPGGGVMGAAGRNAAQVILGGASR